MADGFYETRCDVGNTADADPDPWEDAADFDFGTDPPTVDLKTSFSGVLGQSGLAS